MSLTIRAVTWDDPAGARLRDEQQAEIIARYGGKDGEPGEKPTADTIDLFLLAELDGVAVGCGGLRRIDHEHGEIKRMYVAPQARGSGASIAILRALEREASAAGWRRLVLETGTGQPDAMRFYAREGWVPIPCWGAYALDDFSRCFGIELPPSDLRPSSS
ncbi:GNAT family N-acetyltransferase [uncultured Amnibacterium sp.]|uniref:GNAT family N-acetyltransferase n=1 Tax=uncultured Amnibacterium sp. TaxID=1631851 RepID=UPI0035C995D4